MNIKEWTFSEDGLTATVEGFTARKEANGKWALHSDTNNKCYEFETFEDLNRNVQAVFELIADENVKSMFGKMIDAALCETVADMIKRGSEGDQKALTRIFDALFEIPSIESRVALRVASIRMLKSSINRHFDLMLKHGTKPKEQQVLTVVQSMLSGLSSAIVEDINAADVQDSRAVMIISVERMLDLMYFTCKFIDTANRGAGVRDAAEAAAAFMMHSLNEAKNKELKAAEVGSNGSVRG